MRHDDTPLSGRMKLAFVLVAALLTAQCAIGLRSIYDLVR